MKEGFNQAILLGNIGQDPELRFGQTGNAALNIRMATTEVYFDRDKQKQERTNWHTVVVFGKRAEALGGILKKGHSIHVVGSISNTSYEGRDGQKKYKSEVIARNVTITGWPKDSGAPRQQRAPAESNANGYVPVPDAFGDDSNIPF